MEVWTLTDAINLMPNCQNIEKLADKSKPYVYTKGEQTIRYSASSVAKYCGLHQYADIVEDFHTLLYQDLSPMLEHDARLLSLKLITKRDELEALIKKTGPIAEPQLREILAWTSEADAPSTTNTTTDQLRTRVEMLIEKAEKKEKLTETAGQELKRSMLGRISVALGRRNESIAIRQYEAKHK